MKNIAKDLGLKIKVLMRHEIGGQSPSTKTDSIILNLESTKENGSHWVCIYKQKYYFDPYGILPIKNINYEMYNTLQILPDNTKMCGQLCLYILYRIDRGDSDFSQLILNTKEEMTDLYN